MGKNGEPGLTILFLPHTTGIFSALDLLARLGKTATAPISIF
jgi:hypothetical protein